MQFNELVEARRSVRKYVQSEISRAELETIIAEALNAPSWKNTEVTRYYAAIDEQAKSRLWDESVLAFNVERSRNAAALVAIAFKRGESGFTEGEPTNELGEMLGAYDCGLASSYFILAAKDHGWDSLIMGCRDERRVREIFGIDDDEVLMSVIALGKSGQPYAKNQRKTIQEVFKVL